VALINRSSRHEFDQERFEAQLQRYEDLVERAEKAQEEFGLAATKAMTAISALRKAADNLSDKLRGASRSRQW
jgi:hypothetical protein